MAHIFISYNRAERSLAARLAERLTEAGYDVWWDAALLGGSKFEDEINLVLGEAPVAIILWSRNSVASDWVRAEAEIARKRNTAVPVVVDEVAISALPILFQQIHVIDLKGWNGDDRAPGYVQILKAVVGRVGQQSGPTLTASEAQAKLNEDSEEAAVWADIVGAKDVSADDYRQYLKRYGAKGHFASIAQMRIERLDRIGRRARRRVAVLGVTLGAVVLLVGAITFLLRPDLLAWLPWLRPPPACAEADVVSSEIARFSLCLDHRVWHHWEPEKIGDEVYYQTGDKQITLIIDAGTVNVAPEDRLQGILTMNDGLKGTVGKTVITSQTTAMVDGRQWNVWAYDRPVEGQTESNLTYFYTAPAFGQVELTMYSRSGAAALPPYLESIVKSAMF